MGILTNRNTSTKGIVRVLNEGNEEKIEVDGSASLKEVVSNVANKHNFSNYTVHDSEGKPVAQSDGEKSIENFGGTVTVQPKSMGARN